MAIPSLEEIQRAKAVRFASRPPQTAPPSDPSVDPRTLKFGLDLIMSKSPEDWDKLAAQKSFRAFIARMYPTYTRATHIDLLTAALEKAMDTPNYRLIITMPPRHSKSLHVSENVPAYYLGRYPDRRIITASHTAELSYTFSRRVRNKILDPRWPFDNVTVAGDKSAVKAWDIAGRLGGYMAVGVGGSPAGHGGNLIIIDDPIGSVAEAESQASRDALWEWYQGTIRDRLEPGGSMIVTATRWHEEDLTGHLLTEMRNGGEIWNHLWLPAINSQGEALWPERWPVKALEQIKKAVGTRVWEARFQGNPTPMEGGLLRRDWWKFYRTVPPNLTGHIQSWDMSFRETRSGSYVVGQIWACLGADRYLLDQIRFRGDFTVASHEVREFTKKWPQAKLKLIENKANGPAIVAALRHEISGLIEVNPIGGKLARASAVSPQIEAGNVYLPDPEIKPWVYDFIEECASFPHGANDDQVDAMSQALSRLEKKAIPKTPVDIVPTRTPLGRLSRVGGLSRPFVGRLGR